MSDLTQGYDYEFVDVPVPDALVCLICTLVARDPQQVVCCGRVYCNTCLDRLPRLDDSSRICPQCRVAIQSFPDTRSDRDVKSLHVYCDSRPTGCEWTGELREMEKHTSLCKFALLPCPNQCNSAGILRKNLKKHTNDECPRRWFYCRHCSKKGEYQEITTTHLRECPEFTVTCPNDGCLEEIPRRKISQHRKDCPFEEVACKYARIGCKARVLMKDRSDHESDDKEHLQVAIDSVHEHQQAIHSLKDRIASLQSKMKLDQFKFKLDKFSEHKRHDSRVYSPSFYSGPGGYKMCLSVCANGNRRGKGNSVSVYIHLMCGENDDHLAWPFTGTVRVALLSQIEDDNHWYQSANFATAPDDSETNRRVYDCNNRGKGFGWTAFISHSQLNYDESVYLPHDTLYFMVTVCNPPTNKPWLANADTFECS